MPGSEPKDERVINKISGEALNNLAGVTFI